MLMFLFDLFPKMSQTMNPYSLLNDVFFFFPEMFLFCSIILIFCFLLIQLQSKFRLLHVMFFLSIFSCCFYFFLLLDQPNFIFFLFFNGSIQISYFIQVSKMIITFLTIMCFLGSINYVIRLRYISLEFFILYLLCLFAGICLLSAGDFLIMILSMELLSFSLYILTCTYRKSFLSIEAGLKYFVLGGIASGILLFGVSIIYGFTGIINFNSLCLYLVYVENIYPWVYFGIFMLFFAFLFKVGAAPFHFWVADVYEGLPVHLNLYFFFVPKFTFLFFIFKLIFFVFFIFYDFLQSFFFFSIVCSLIIGNFSAISQVKLRRLFAFSAIGHLGFIFACLILYSLEAITAFFFYLFVYFMIMFPIFIILMYLEESNSNLKRNTPLFLRSYLEINPVLVICFTFLLLSLGGLPPLLGFFAKYLIIYACFSSSFYFLAVLLVLASCVGFFYYLQLVNFIWSRRNQFIKVKSIDISFLDSCLIMFFTFFNVCFLFFPFYILDFIQLFVLYIFK